MGRVASEAENGTLQVGMRLSLSSENHSPARLFITCPLGYCYML